MARPIVLRGHHLLCQFGFRGYGYSADFVAQMSRVLEDLRKRPDQAVQLVDYPDVWCEAFPSEQPCHCREPIVIARDRAVLQQLGVESGAILPWATWVKRAHTRFVGDDLLTLCATCPWLPLGYCQQGLETAQGILGP